MNSTEPTTPGTWPSGQAGWYRLAKRCSWVTKLTPEGFAATWCGQPAPDHDYFCPEHRAKVIYEQ